MRQGLSFRAGWKHATWNKEDGAKQAYLYQNLQAEKTEKGREKGARIPLSYLMLLTVATNIKSSETLLKRDVWLNLAPSREQGWSTQEEQNQLRVSEGLSHAQRLPQQSFPDLMWTSNQRVRCANGLGVLQNAMRWRSQRSIPQLPESKWPGPRSRPEPVAVSAGRSATLHTREIGSVQHCPTSTASTIWPGLKWWHREHGTATLDIARDLLGSRSAPGAKLQKMTLVILMAFEEPLRGLLQFCGSIDNPCLCYLWG